MLTLSVQKRNEIGKSLGKLRKAGFVPGIIYGADTEAQPIAVPVADLMRAWREAGESALLSVKVQEDEPRVVLIRELQQDPVVLAPIHVDFHQVSMDEELEIAVPLEFVGEAPAVKEQVGVLVKDLHELEIRALPKNLPREITVDLSGLAAIEDMVQVRDLIVPEGVEVMQSQEMAVAHIAPLISEAELAGAPEEMSVEDVKVEGEKKAAEEETEAAEEKAPR